MKKKITILLFFVMIIAVCGYLCFVIFADKNIKSVEPYVNCKQIYFLEENFDIDNLMLRVTYQSGRVEIIKGSDTDVKIRYFNSSTTGLKVMSLFYKMFEVKLAYAVIEQGAYINDNANKIFDFKSNGNLVFYEKISDKWIIRDSAFDSSMNFTIVNDKIILNDTLKTSFIELSEELYFQADIRNENMVLFFGKNNEAYTKTKITDSFGLPISAEFNQNFQPFSRISYLNNTAVFKLNQNIGESGLVLDVLYSKGEHFYVTIGDKMFNDGQLETSKLVLNTTRSTGHFLNLAEIVLFYQVTE